MLYLENAALNIVLGMFLCQLKLLQYKQYRVCFRLFITTISTAFGANIIFFFCLLVTHFLNDAKVR